MLIQECQILDVVVENELNAVLHVGLCAVNHIVDVSEANLRLNHPEFGYVTSGV
jgi:hypothetical protein